MSFETNNSFNSTIMASFLPVIVSEQKEQTNKEKYVFYCSVSQIHINPEKTRVLSSAGVKRSLTGTAINPFKILYRLVSLKFFLLVCKSVQPRSWIRARAVACEGARGQLPPLEFSEHTCKMAHFVTKLTNAATPLSTAPPGFCLRLRL